MAGKVQGTGRSTADRGDGDFERDAVLQKIFLRVSACDDHGRFEIGGLRPGDYYAAAYDKRAESTDDVFIAGVVAAGNKVRVEGGQSTLVTLKVTPLPEQ